MVVLRLQRGLSERVFELEMPLMGLRHYIWLVAWIYQWKIQYVIRSILNCLQRKK